MFFMWMCESRLAYIWKIMPHDYWSTGRLVSALDTLAHFSDLRNMSTSDTTCHLKVEKNADRSRAAFCWWARGQHWWWIIINYSLEQWITGEGSEEGLCPLPRFFHFWSLKSLVLLHFSAIFVSSSTTDGLLRNELSGGGPLLVGARGHAPPLIP